MLTRTKLYLLITLSVFGWIMLFLPSNAAADASMANPANRIAASLEKIAASLERIERKLK